MFTKFYDELRPQFQTSFMAVVLLLLLDYVAGVIEKEGRKSESRRKKEEWVVAGIIGRRERQRRARIGERKKN